ncbi:polysaccharide pyruvyl transferase family protein [uncultured Martelella sp.]|uniref:polysaccharide pyruvyl transferase family protein n=1 Tax=uncultured Martelella sp. TaxID=392331 RepID=UPI0029C8B256|nr:polysaccharide pyruvyl transferase family protein [uncultured Martelella sp.]
MKFFKKKKKQAILREPRLDGSSVELFYWTPPSGIHNFGDHLSKIIVTKLLADQGLFLEQETSKKARMLAIGSILHFANDQNTIWGTGINGKTNTNSYNFNELDVRAVRGPKTREFLMEKGITVPEIYGDPALLCKALLPNTQATDKKRKLLFVPNLNDDTYPKGVEVLSPLLPWNRCIKEITSSEFVLASSLHAIVIAEAYGIPARYLRISEVESLFKYEDYVLGTGRKSLEFATSVEEAKEMGGMPKISFSSEKLIGAFPYDLWS